MEKPESYTKWRLLVHRDVEKTDRYFYTDVDKKGYLFRSFGYTDKGKWRTQSQQANARKNYMVIKLLRKGG